MQAAPGAAGDPGATAAALLGATAGDMTPADDTGAAACPVDAATSAAQACAAARCQADGAPCSLCACCETNAASGSHARARTFQEGVLKSAIDDSGSTTSPTMPSSARASSATSRSSSSDPEKNGS